MLQSLKQLYWDIRFGPKRVFSIRKEGLDCILEILGKQFRWRRRLTRYEKLFYFKRFKENFSENDKRYYLDYQFQERLGRTINWDNPQTFNEKLQWLKLYYHNPLMTQCADKLSVREYVKSIIGQEYLNELIATFDSPEQINFDELPEKFVLKVNWGWSQNILCSQKSLLNIEQVKSNLKLWLENNNNNYYHSLEWCYKNITPKIICEKYIEHSPNTDLQDYKILCFNGVPEYLWVDVARFKNHQRNLYDRNWNLLPFIWNYPSCTEKLKKPEKLDIMFDLAEKLSKPFPFVRVDFYYVDNNIIFGEMTFYPEAGYGLFNPPEWDLKLGQMLQLPEKWI